MFFMRDMKLLHSFIIRMEGILRPKESGPSSWFRCSFHASALVMWLYHTNVCYSRFFFPKKGTCII